MDPAKTESSSAESRSTTLLKMMGEYPNGMLISAVNEYDGEEMLNLLLVDDRIPAGAKLY